MEKKQIKATGAPAAIGPYSQAILVGNILFCAGQIGADPKTNVLVEGGINAQTKQVFENLKYVLEAANAGFADVAKVNVYLQNINDFPEMNKIYAGYFHQPFPARATVEVAKLPKGALIEVDCIAYLKEEGGCCGGCC